MVHPTYSINPSLIKPRTNHEGVFYDNKIFYLFGWQSYATLKRDKCYLDDVVIYDTIKNELSLGIPEHQNTYKFFAGRKNFTGF